jgi:VWFA-related protein
MPIRSLAAPLGISLLGPVILLAAARPQQQSPADQPSLQESAPALTLHAESRIVLADVTVTDRHGNAVHGLTAQDFEVFDNDKQQRISSFEEHDGSRQTAYTPPRSTGPATNLYQHLPPVLNVILIDTTNLELPDQMYLRIQLTKFLKNLPPNQPLAVFDRHADFTILLQPFTADHALLQSAVDRAIPRIPLGGREYRTDPDTLRQIGAYLAEMPGRKNVLWFSGGSTAYLLYGLTALTAGASVGPAPNSAAAAAAAAASAPATGISAAGGGDNPDEMREVYDELEAARIIIYPVDARGLTTEGNVALGPQQSQMEETAEATGGQAFFNSNGLAAIASRVITTDSTSYTVTWSPQDFHYDGKWHSIRIVPRNRDYHLSYRRGYFADKSHTIDPGAHKRTALFAGDTAPITTPDLRTPPLVFEATVHPASAAPEAQDFVPIHTAPARRGTKAFAVDYSLSTAALTPAMIDGSPRSTAVFAILALDADGNRVGQLVDAVRLPAATDGPARKLQVEQQIDLPTGSGFLTLYVWDPNSGHIGTLQVPVTVTSKSK